MVHKFASICSLLLRRECCTFSNGEYVKSGLSLLEKWIFDVTEEVLAFRFADGIKTIFFNVCLIIFHPPSSMLGPHGMSLITSDKLLVFW
jgi:hypothetical protein